MWDDTMRKPNKLWKKYEIDEKSVTGKLRIRNPLITFEYTNESTFISSNICTS